MRNIIVSVLMVALPVGLLAQRNDPDSLKVKLANTTSDSVKAVLLKDLGYEYRRINLDSALEFTNEARKLAKKLGDTYQLRDLLSAEGVIWEFAGKIDTAIVLFQSIIPSDSSRYDGLTGWALQRLGTIYRRQGNFERSLFYYQSSIEVDKIFKPERQIESLGLISLLYNDWHDCGAGLAYGWKAKALHNSLKPPNDYGLYNRLGVLHMCLHNYDSAIYYYDKDYFSKTIPPESSNHGIYHHNIAYVLETKGDKKEGIKRYKKAIELKEKYNSAYSKSLSYHAIAEVYYELAVIEKQPQYSDSAIYFSEKSQAMALNGHDLRMIKKTHGLLADIYAYAGNNEKYIFHKNLLMNYTDSLFNNERAQVMGDLETKYQVKEKETENLQLANENLQKAAVIQRQNYIFIGGAIVLILIIIGLYTVYRNNIKIRALNKQIETSNQAKDRLFSIISHDLRGPIASFETTPKMLKSYLTKNQPEKMEELVDHIDRSARNLNRLLDNLLNWSLSQKDELVIHIEKLSIKPIIEEIIEVFNDAAALKSITIQSTIEEQWVMADRNTFSTVVRNLISNAVKFSRPGTSIIIDHRVNDNWIELKITDQGVGMTEEQLAKLFLIDKTKVRSGTANEKGTGLGMVLIKEFIEINKGQIMVESMPDHGTVFYMSLPLAS